MTTDQQRIAEQTAQKITDDCYVANGASFFDARGAEFHILRALEQSEGWVKVLDAIAGIAGDDFCEDLAMQEAYKGLRGDKKTAYEKLSAIYRLAHAFSPNHSCYDVHEDWRKELQNYAIPSPPNSDSSAGEGKVTNG